MTLRAGLKMQNEEEYVSVNTSEKIKSAIGSGASVEHVRFHAEPNVTLPDEVM
jgi:hypothetical protein